MHVGAHSTHEPTRSRAVSEPGARPPDRRGRARRGRGRLRRDLDDWSERSGDVELASGRERGGARGGARELDPEIFLLAGRTTATRSSGVLDCCPTSRRASSRSPRPTRRRATRWSSSSAAGFDAVIVPAGNVAELVGGAPPAGLNGAVRVGRWGGPRRVRGDPRGRGRPAARRAPVRAAVPLLRPGRAEHRPARVADGARRRARSALVRLADAAHVPRRRRSRRGRARRRT